MKKGFTLIELLAVIVILAIIALIATPIILGVVENARKSAAGSSALGYLDAVEKAIALDGLDNIVYPTGNIDILTTNYYKDVEVQGEGPSQGTLVVSDRYLITSATLCVNNYKVELTGHKIKSITKDGCGDMRELYKEDILHGADPVLKGNLIPVTIDEATGTVTQADIYDEWYKYEKQKWANSVVLVDNPSKEYTEGDTIAESDIRAYFVWIPKYSYRIFNMGNYDGLVESQPESQIQEIEIEFGTKNTTEVDGECITPMGSGLSRATTATKDCVVGDLMTHPAFLSIPSNGFWVGKFETGYNQNTNSSEPITTENISTWTKENAQVNEEKPNNIIVKPNVYSWRNSTVYNYFMSAYNFNRNLDSHMMKNTEWGAVAYLSHSKYGINDEVRINNNSKFLTGYAANEKDASESETTNSKWNTPIGHLASTTGNITGIYDMSGGAYEYMASYIDENAKESEMDTIITNEIYNKYLDKYSKLVTSITSYNYRILGDATGELGPFYGKRMTWYTDFSEFVEPDRPWFARGGWKIDATPAGQFSFERWTGGATFDYSSHGTRLVLG